MRAHKSVVMMVTNEVTAVTFYRGYLRYLKNAGWKVAVTASSSGKLETLGRAEGVSAFDLPMHREPSPLHDLASLLRTIILLARLRPEVVVAATPKAGLLGMIAAWLTRVPIRVYQMWGLRLETEVGWRRRVFTTLERVATSLSTHVVANSVSLAEEIEALGISSGVTVLGHGSSHGVDLKFFDPSATDIPAAEESIRKAAKKKRGTVTVGYVGRVHRDKGVDTLVRAAEIYAEHGAIRLLIVGPSEDTELEGKLSAPRSDNLSVIRVGSVGDTRPYFLLMDVHVLPTRREGFPNVVLEAAALGIPTITTRATGARDSIVDGVTGRLVGVDDAEAIARHIAEFASNPALRNRFAKDGREHVRNHFERYSVLALQENYLVRLRAEIRTTPCRSGRKL